MTVERTMGVDGCRAGWFYVVIDASGNAKFGIFRRISELWVAFADAAVILIDIPIGLISGAGTGRSCDSAARMVLGTPRRSSVFSPPCRPALSQSTYRGACSINLRVCGKKISRQAWGISRKIKEVDDFLRGCPDAVEILRETHPEICFWALAGGAPMAYGKKTAAGEAQRLALLERIYPKSKSIFKDALNRFLRKDLARDDIIDALANAVAASRLNAGYATLPADPPRDRFGLAMEIVYAQG